MKNNIIVQISEGLGNQLFMYAHAYSLSQKLGKELLIDNTSGYYKDKNLLRPHQKYMLNFFQINNNLAPSNYRYDNFTKNILKKVSIFGANSASSNVTFPFPSVVNTSVFVPSVTCTEATDGSFVSTIYNLDDLNPGINKYLLSTSG